MIPRLRNVAVDCNDLDAMVRFWSELLDYRVLARDEKEALLAPGDDVRPRLFFQTVPERPQSKNRVHMDLDVGEDELEPAIARAERLGARRVESFVEDDGYGWWVLADPEGNCFCIGRLPD
ncbi:MAG TPA: VOC family protein [Actinomycetota bacterium]|nr:VOC family protein [Actinomycetota bacterium]